jgi:hypothetical protein
VPGDEKWVPYRLMREWASSINPDDVECLKFGGPQMGGFIGYDPIIVYDRRLIRRFIDALKQASLPAPPPGKKALATTMGINVMMICFRHNGRERRSTEEVNFFPCRPKDCFGPAFFITHDRRFTPCLRKKMTPRHFQSGCGFQEQTD